MFILSIFALISSLILFVLPMQAYDMVAPEVVLVLAVAVSWLAFIVISIYKIFRKIIFKHPFGESVKQYLLAVLFILVSFGVTRIRGESQENNLDVMRARGDKILEMAIEHRKKTGIAPNSIDDLKNAGYSIPESVIKNSEFSINTQSNMISIMFPSSAMIICQRVEDTIWICKD